MTKALAYLTLGAAMVAAGAGPAFGGMGGGLAGLLDEPDDGASAQPPGEGAPVPADKPKEGAPASAPARAATDAETIDKRIAELERRAKKLRETPADDIPPVNNLEEAEKFVQTVKETQRKAHERIDLADREAARRAEQKAGRFEEEWNKHLDGLRKGLTTKDLLKGERPPDMDPLEWAALCDRYFSQRAEMEAELAETAQKLTAKRRKDTAALDDAVARAEEWLEKWKKAPGKLDKLHQLAMGLRRHQAALAAVEQRLADQKKLRAELKGDSSGRQDMLSKEAYRGTGFWMSDAIKNQVWREMTLSDCTQPPETRPDQPFELKPPEWMGVYDHLDRQREKCKWIAEQLRLAHRAYQNAEKEILEEDKARLRRSREVTEEMDREDGLLNDPAAVKRREAALEREAKALEATRADRAAERKRQYADDIEQRKKMLERESKVLAEMEPKPAATQPGS
jgi:hypothetical protein